MDKIRLPFPQKRVDIETSDKYAQQIQHIASDIAEGYNSRLKPYRLSGFRLHKSLISLVKASALRDGRTKVIQEDVERIRCLSRWMNLEMNPLMLDYPLAGNDRL